MTDLLASLLADAAEGDLLVPNGATRGGWHVYPSSRGGSWVADQLRTPQVDHTLHLRTADADGRPGTLPTWHRSYHTTHFARPTVHCSFRIDRHDDTRNILGFKLAYLHQGNNHSYYVSLHTDGRVQVWREARDSGDGAGRSLASARWEHRPGARRHLTVGQDAAGTISVVVDGRQLLAAHDPSPWHSGQVGLRLDGLDARIFSLVAKETDMAAIDRVLSLPQQSPAQWGARRDYDTWTPAGPKDGVTVHYVGSAEVQRQLVGDHSRCAGHIRGIENHHIGTNGWSGIGYNFIICPHGVLFRGRGEAQGAHNPEDSDRDGLPDNVDSVGVLVLVGGDERPTSDALAMLKRVCDAMGGYVVPHSLRRATSCPGDPLRAWIDDYHDPATDPEEDDMGWSDWMPERIIKWARSIGLTSKDSDPQATITHEQMVALLERYDRNVHGGGA